MNPALPFEIEMLKDYIVMIYAKQMIENKAIEINHSELANKEQVLQSYIEAFKLAHADDMEIYAAILRTGFKMPAITRDENKVIIRYNCRGHEGTLTLPLKGLLYLADRRMKGYLKSVNE